MGLLNKVYVGKMQFLTVSEEWHKYVCEDRGDVDIHCECVCYGDDMSMWERSFGG